MKFICILKNIIKKEDEKMKFYDIANEWLEYKRNSVKKSTYGNYLYIIEKYLNTQFGEQNVEEIISYNEFIQDLSDRLAPKTVRDITNVLKAILSYYEDEYGIKLNKKKMSLPKQEKKRLQILTPKEKQKLETYCMEEDTLKNLGIIVCLNTGMRIGEICALKWKNIDLDEGNIYIKHTLQRIYNKKTRKTEVIIDTPKSSSSVRTIPINKKLYNILKTLKKKYTKETFFLTGLENKHVEPRNYQNTFKAILKKCKIKKYKFHILRHTMATNCIEIGMDIKTLSEILGHANVEITLNKYVHSSRKLMKKYLEKL